MTMHSSASADANACTFVMHTPFLSDNICSSSAMAPIRKFSVVDIVLYKNHKQCVILREDKHLGYSKYVLFNLDTGEKYYNATILDIEDICSSEVWDAELADTIWPATIAAKTGDRFAPITRRVLWNLQTVAYRPPHNN